MKFKNFFIVALIVSSNVHADLQIFDCATNDATQVDFGAVDPSSSNENLASSVRYVCIHNSGTSGTSAISPVTLTISGNAGEFCFDYVDYTGFHTQEPGPCPTTNEDIGSLNAGETVPVEVWLNGKHSGNKKKKLTVDGVVNQNDVSSSIWLIGTSVK